MPGDKRNRPHSYILRDEGEEDVPEETIRAWDRRLIDFVYEPFVYYSIYGVGRAAAIGPVELRHYQAANAMFHDRWEREGWNVIVRGRVFPDLFPDWQGTPDAPKKPTTAEWTAALEVLLRRAGYPPAAKDVA